MQNTQYVAEIVRFTARPGASPEALAEASAGLAGWLGGQAGFVARALSRAPDGSYTDHVIWTSMEAAKAAAEAIMSAPAAGAFMALIDPASVEMSHAPIVTRQAA